MHSDTDLHLIERAFKPGRPYAYGSIPIRPLGGPLGADSRPQPLQSDPEGDGRKSTDRARDVLDLIDLWDRFKDTFKEIPGLWRSLLGILATPLRWLRWALATSTGRWSVAAILILLAILFLTLPLFGRTGGRDARCAEGHQLLGSARDFLRVKYAGKYKLTSEAMNSWYEEVGKGQFAGEYYTIEPRLVIIDESRARIYAHPTTHGEPVLCMEFEWRSGNSNLRRLEPGERR